MSKYFNDMTNEQDLLNNKTENQSENYMQMYLELKKKK